MYVLRNRSIVIVFKQTVLISTLFLIFHCCYWLDKALVEKRLFRRFEPPVYTSWQVEIMLYYL